MLTKLATRWACLWGLAAPASAPLLLGACEHVSGCSPKRGGTPEASSSPLPAPAQPTAREERVCPLHVNAVDDALAHAVAASVPKLCAVLVETMNHDRGDMEPARCAEQRALAPGFSLLSIDDSGNVAYLVAGQATDGWRVIAEVGTGFEGRSLLSFDFKVEDVRVMTAPRVGVLLRVDTALTQWDSDPGQLEESEATSRTTTVCARSPDANQQRCLHLPAAQVGARYRLRVRDAAAPRESDPYERIPEPVESWLARARVQLNAEGVVRYELLDGSWKTLGAAETQATCPVQEYDFARQ